MAQGGPRGGYLSFICQICSGDARKFFENNTGLKPKAKPDRIRKVTGPDAVEIKRRLDQYVVGQEQAKVVLSVAVTNHQKRIQTSSFEEGDDAQSGVELDKSNVLLLGPTGVGKTALVQALAEIVELPLAIGDATTLTEAGYVGDDVENLLVRLLQKTDGDVALAEKGIIFIDEIDKIAASRGNVSITRDVSGVGVQQGLLKLLEGTITNVPPEGGRKHPEQKCIPVNTKNILFICGGAFGGLEEIVSRRLGRRQIGFAAETDSAMTDLASRGNPLAQVKLEDLVQFGMIPEFVGRLPVVATLQALDEDALRRILVEPKNSLIRQYQKLFEFDGVELEFRLDALTEIARKAKAVGTNARGLRSVVEKVMLPLMFRVRENKNRRCIVDAATVKRAFA